eukprot:11196923-Lingulodinium_polyedra.AAC.1
MCRGNLWKAARSSARVRRSMVRGNPSPNDTTNIAGPPAVRHGKHSTICFLFAAQTMRPFVSRPYSMNSTFPLL